LFEQVTPHQQQAIEQIFERQAADRLARRKARMHSREFVDGRKQIYAEIANRFDPDGVMFKRLHELSRNEKARIREFVPNVVQKSNPPRVTPGSMRCVAMNPVERHGIYVNQNGPGKVLMYGSAHDMGDDRVIFDVGVNAVYTLEPNRLNPSGENPPRWTSTPVASIFGRVYGWTGLWNPFFAADDKWAKCRLKIHQEVVQVSAAGASNFIGASSSLGSSKYDDFFVIIDEENKMQWTDRDVSLDTYLLPSASFGLANDTDPIFAVVSILFEVELEGEAAISFGDSNNGFQPQTDIEIFAWTPWAH
jgi:hypothetical protein